MGLLRGGQPRREGARVGGRPSPTVPGAVCKEQAAGFGVGLSGKCSR